MALAGSVASSLHGQAPVSPQSERWKKSASYSEGVAMVMLLCPLLWKRTSWEDGVDRSLLRRGTPEGQTAELILASWYSPPVYVVHSVPSNPVSCSISPRVWHLLGSSYHDAVACRLFIAGIPMEFCLVPEFLENSFLLGIFFSRPLCQEGWGRVHSSVIVGYLLVAWVLVSPMTGWSLYN